MSLANRVLSASAKPSDKKRVLTAANKDTIAFDPAETIADNDSIEFAGSCIQMAGYNYIFGALGGGYVGIKSNSMRLVVGGITYNEVITAPLVDEVFTLELSKDALDNYYLSLNAATPVLMGNNVSDFDTRNIGRISGSSTYSSISVNEFSLGVELFDLNNGNGFNPTGSLGTVSLGQTSAADPTNYWNQNVIRPI